MASVDYTEDAQEDSYGESANNAGPIRLGRSGYYSQPTERNSAALDFSAEKPNTKRFNPLISALKVHPAS